MHGAERFLAFEIKTMMTTIHLIDRQTAIERMFKEAESQQIKKKSAVCNAKKSLNAFRPWWLSFLPFSR